MEQFNPGQIKKNIKQLKQREEQYLYYLGQLAFHAGEQGKLDDPGMLEAYRTVKDIQAQVAQSEASLEELKAAKEAAQSPRCPSCGGAVSKGAVFCANCGVSLAAPPAAAAPAVPGPSGRLCSNCGAPLDADAIFCGNCGAKSAGEVVAETMVLPASGPTVSPAYEPPPQAVPQAVTEAGTPAQEGPAQVAAAVPEPQATEEPSPPLEETHACPKCATGISDKDMLFCPKCGTKVRE
jgi:hypothetical protein